MFSVFEQASIGRSVGVRSVLKHIGNVVHNFVKVTESFGRRVIEARRLQIEIQLFAIIADGHFEVSFAMIATGDDFLDRGDVVGHRFDDQPIQ